MPKCTESEFFFVLKNENKTEARSTRKKKQEKKEEKTKPFFFLSKEGRFLFSTLEKKGQMVFLRKKTRVFFHQK